MDYAGIVRDRYANGDSPRSTSGMLDSPVTRRSAAERVRLCVTAPDYSLVETHADSTYDALIGVDVQQPAYQRQPEDRRARACSRSPGLLLPDLHPAYNFLLPVPLADGQRRSPTAALATPASLPAEDVRLAGSPCWPPPSQHGDGLPLTASDNLPLLPLAEEPPGFCLTSKHYRFLGSSGLRVSSLSLGTSASFGPKMSDLVAEQIVTMAYESGINYFDTAEAHTCGRAQMLLGKIIKAKGWPRSSLVVATRVTCSGEAETERTMNRKRIVENVKQSLQRLQMEYVDIVFAGCADGHTPTEEVVRAFTFIINQGWAMYWGTCRWSSRDIMAAYSIARKFNLIPPTVEQAEYNLLRRERVETHLMPLMHKIGIGTIGCAPLACGILAGKYEDGIPIHSRAALKEYAWLKDKILSEDGRLQQQKLRKLNLVAAQLNCSLAQLAIAWCIKNSNISSVLMGVSSADQLRENLLAFEVAKKMTQEILDQIEDLLK